jgi:hypothetical protein
MKTRTLDDLMNLKKGMYVAYYKKAIIYVVDVAIDDPTGYSVPVQAINTALTGDTLYRWEDVIEACPNILKAKLVRFKKYK